ncbi:uncharacterized protein LOC135351557 [Halichondria panicea]|uniref:uncharacterized protein LOC135351557 n=1 Tax=Halichondria panicea TaxID=6063 RepID=UPI00312B4E46
METGIKVETSRRCTPLGQRCQLHLNLFIVAFMQLLLAIIFSTPISSFYLFVTSQPPSSNNTDEIVDWQGLGQSDTFYSWVITLLGIAILSTSLVLMCLPFLSFFRVLMVFNFLILITSGLTYALAFRPWVILASYCIRGVGFSMSEVLVIGYISVTPRLLPRVDNKRRIKSTFSVKDRYLAITLMFRAIGWPIGLGIAALMAQYRDTVDQFRWPGWANATVSILYAFIFFITFRKVESGTAKAGEGRSTTTWCHCQCVFFKDHLSTDKMKSTLKKIRLRNVLVCVYLALSGHLMTSTGSILGTLVPPILSDHFGFDIDFISYFTLGVLATSFVGAIILIVLKCLRVNNRYLFAVVLAASICGTVLASDWQAIGEDPCTLSGFNSSQHFEPPEALSELRDVCLSQNGDCYWNQDSELTGTYCSLCRPICRSTSMTINLAQFCVAVVLIHLSGLIGWTAILGVATDYTPHHLRSVVVALMFMMDGASWLLTPLWSISIYNLVGRRTFAPMSVWSGMQLVSLIGLLLLYKLLGPIKKPQMT